MFDSGVPAVRPAKREKSWIPVLGFTILFLGIAGLLAFFTYQSPERTIIPPGPQEVHIVADDTKPSPTATVVACTPGMEVGTICRFYFTPTPLANCPPVNDKTLCVYTGVENFRERKK